MKGRSVNDFYLNANSISLLSTSQYASKVEPQIEFKRTTSLMFVLQDLHTVDFEICSLAMLAAFFFIFTRKFYLLHLCFLKNKEMLWQGNESR
jgi:hypothetical protein